MIYIIGILALVGIIAFIFTLLVKVYNEDQKTQDERTLVLEKRMQEQHKCFSGTINDFKDAITNLTIENSNLERRLQKLERARKLSNER